MASTSPTTDNGRTIAGMYEAFGRGDVPHVLAQMALDVEWIETEAESISVTGSARSGALHSLPLLFRLFRMPWGGRLGRGNDDREREGIRRDEVAGLDFGPVR